MLKLWELCAIERADVLAGMTPQQCLAFWGSCEVPWSHHAMRGTIYRELAAALAGNLAVALGQIDLLEARLDELVPDLACADVFNADCACVPCEMKRPATREEMAGLRDLNMFDGSLLENALND